MNDTIHFFDLDGTLWNVNNKAWIIDKKNPSKPILIIKGYELTDILSNIYKTDDIAIEYNGNKYFISEVMFDRIKKKIKNIKEDQLGISFIEMINPVYSDVLKFNKNNIRHLIDKDKFDLGIISARSNVDRDEKLLNALNKELNDIGLEINKFYYVSDYFKPTNSNDTIAYKKARILLEHLVGFHLKGDKFVPLKQDLYKVVHFYDDDFNNVNIAGTEQDLLEEYLRNTDDEVFNRIMDNINENKPELYTHLITNNSVNKFKTEKIELKIPVKYPIKIEESFKTKFSEFLKNKY